MPARWGRFHCLNVAMIDERTHWYVELFGIYEGVGNNQRVAIFLDPLGRKVRVSIDIDSVVAA